MSWRAAGIVKGLTENLTRSEKIVLLTLADYYNDETQLAWPGEERLARETLLSKRHLIRVLHSLRDKGFITIEHRTGRYQTNLYTMPCVSTDVRGDMVSPPTGHGVTPGVTSDVTQTVREPKRSTSDDDDLKYMKELARFIDTYSSSGSHIVAIKAPGPYWKTLRREGATFKRVDLKCVDEVIGWLTAAYTSHEKTAHRLVTIPAPSYIEGLAQVWPTLQKNKLGPQTLNLVLHRVCEEHGIELTADNVLAQVGAHADTFIDSVEQLVASVRG